MIAFCRGTWPATRRRARCVSASLPKTSTGKIQKFVLRGKAKSATAIA